MRLIGQTYSVTSRTPAGRVVGNHELPPDAQPDAEVTYLAQAEIDKSDSKLTFSVATIKVLNANPELAHR
jgi:hypothetical protein